jgi:hypothetical protein
MPVPDTTVIIVWAVLSSIFAAMYVYLRFGRKIASRLEDRAERRQKKRQEKRRARRAKTFEDFDAKIFKGLRETGYGGKLRESANELEKLNQDYAKLQKENDLNAGFIRNMYHYNNLQ